MVMATAVMAFILVVFVMMAAVLVFLLLFVVMVVTAAAATLIFYVGPLIPEDLGRNFKPVDKITVIWIASGNYNDVIH